MKIKELIAYEINKKGKINIAEFIQLCQFENDGYYLKNNPIGEKNDFITAPEISQMFGEILTVFLINYWNEKIKNDFNLVELGPGKGTLIRDLIRTANKHKQFLNAANLTLVEKNNNLINIQKNSINFKRAKWSHEFNIHKNTNPYIIYSNEFFDCFAVRQFYKKEEWHEKFVKYDSSKQIYKFTSEKINNIKLLKFLEKFDNVKVAEISESRMKYFDKVCKIIKKNKGIFVTIDYGYKNPPNYLTLQTIYNHKKTHLFENLGNQDITAHVDFDELIRIANKNKLKINTFCTQRDFLITNGIKERKKKLQENKNQKTIKTLDIEYDRLVNKSQMGEIFKFLVVSCI